MNNFTRGISTKETLKVGIIAKKITQKERRDFVKGKLATSPKWALAALTKIYSYQTASEQNSQYTRDANNKGFTSFDAKILSNFAEVYKKYGRLSPKQMTLLYNKIPKYWKQIVNASDEDQLNNMIKKDLIKK